MADKNTQFPEKRSLRGQGTERRSEEPSQVERNSRKQSIPRDEEISPRARRVKLFDSANYHGD